MPMSLVSIIETKSLSLEETTQGMEVGVAGREGGVERGGAGDPGIVGFGN